MRDLADRGAAGLRPYEEKRLLFGEFASGIEVVKI
jgi:hypothetical protein